MGSRLRLLILLVLLVVCGWSFYRSAALQRDLEASRQAAAVLAEQVRYLSLEAQATSTPEVLLHRFLNAWVQGRGAQVILYLDESLQEVWRQTLRLTRWKPGATGGTIHHYRLDESHAIEGGMSYRITFFGGEDETEPLYTLQVVIRGRPGAYRITQLLEGGQKPAPPP